MIAAVGMLAGCLATQSEVHRDSAPLERRCQHSDSSACGELGLTLIRKSKSANDDRDFGRALVLLEIACGDGDSRACMALGAYYGGDTRKTAQARGRNILHRTCGRRVARACTMLGDILLSQGAAERGPAAAMFRSGCALGDSMSCEWLGDMELPGNVSGGRWLPEALFAEACSMGRLSSCHKMALLELADQARRDDGIRLLRGTCTAGFGPSCTALFLSLAPLIGERPDCEQARPFATSACSAGTASGCAVADACTLADAASGAAALDRLRQQCASGAPLGCLYWADAVARRPETSGDPAAQREAYRISCESREPGRTLACVRIASLDLAGIKNAFDAEKPLSVLRDACAQATAEACCELADHYRTGKWVAGNKAQARQYRVRACELGDRRCCASP